MIEVVDDIPGLGRSGVPVAVAVRRARQRARVHRAVESGTGWPSFAPQTGLAEGPLGEAQAAAREIGRQQARQLRALAAYAATRPASDDLPQGVPGAMSAERWRRVRRSSSRPVSGRRR